MTSEIKIRCPWCERRVRPTRKAAMWTHKPNTRASTGEFLGNCAGSGRTVAQWNELMALRTFFATPPEFNPGSPAAQSAGCRCTALDNNHGRWAPCRSNGWLVALDCPMHRKKHS